MVKPKQYGDYTKMPGTLDDLTEELKGEVSYIVKGKVIDGLLEAGETPDHYKFETIVKQNYMSDDGTAVSVTKSDDCCIPHVTIGVKATEVTQ